MDTYSGVDVVSISIDAPTPATNPVKSPAKSEAAKARNAKRKAEGKAEGGRPRTSIAPKKEGQE